MNERSMAGASTDVGETWRSFYRECCRDDIEELVQEYPTERSLYVDVLDLHGYDADFTERLFSAPGEYLRHGAATLGEVHESFDRVNVRLVNHPGLISLENLRTRHLGELVSIEGLIDDVAPVQAKIEVAVFGCHDCDNLTTHHPTGITLTSPQICPECGTEGPLELQTDRSKFADVQAVTVAEPLGNRLDEDDPRTLEAYLDDDLVNVVTPGDHVRVTGIARQERDGTKNRFDFYLDCITIRDERPGAPSEDESSDEIQQLIESRWQFMTES